MVDNERTMSFRIHEGADVRDRKLKFRSGGELPIDKLDHELEKFVSEFEDKEEKLLRKVHPIKDQLGFIHWILIFSFVGILYLSVVYQDARMPEIVSDNQTTRFSEKKARVLLKQLTGLGPRPSGSDACEKQAFKILTGKLQALKEIVEFKNVNRFETDVQRPTGCYNLKFLSSFTLCYHKITNIIARIGPKPEPTKQSILLNCHFDTMPDTPGATDDAVIFINWWIEAKGRGDPPLGTFLKK